MKKTLIGLVAAALVLAGCGSAPEPEATPHSAENGSAKGRLEMDTTDAVSR